MRGTCGTWRWTPAGRSSCCCPAPSLSSTPSPSPPGSTPSLKENIISYSVEQPQSALLELIGDTRSNVDKKYIVLIARFVSFDEQFVPLSCDASREMENTSRGPTFGDFVTINPHRVVDAEKYDCKTTEYMSTDSMLVRNIPNPFSSCQLNHP
jgi:hypothetical protein